MTQIQKYFFLFGFLLLSLLPFRSFAASPSVLISEINWAGSSLSAADEWVELSNTTSQSVDLSGWTLTGASSSPLVIKDGTTLAPYSTFLIANYDASHANSSITQSPNLVTTNVSLPNSTLLITLQSKEGVAIDTAGSGGSPFAGGSAGSGSASDGQFRSMVRTGVETDGSLSTSWVAAQTANGVKTTMDVGTPGVYDFAVPQITPETSEVVLEAETITIVSEPTTEVVTEPILVVQPVLKTYQKGDLMLNELYSNPNLDEPEWVELVNTTNEPIQTEGWSLVDESGAVTLFPLATIGAHELYVIESPKGKLNNAGDTITIKSPTGDAIDSVTYGTDEIDAPAKAESLMRTQTNTWVITTSPTRQTQNIKTDRVVVTPPAPTQTQTQTPSQASSVAATKMSIRLAKQAAVGVRVMIKGVINSLPGSLGTRYFYLQDETDGIQIYKNDGVFPDMKIGQAAEVTGVVSLAYGEHRIKAASISLSSSSPRLMDPKPLTHLESNLTVPLGSLVNVSGTVISRNANKATLDVQGKKLVVDVPTNSDVDPEMFSRGMKVAVNGILTESNDQVKLKPRMFEDVSVLEDESVDAMKVGAKEQQTTTQQSIATLLSILTTILFAGLWLKPKLYEYLRTRAAHHHVAA